MTQQILSWFTPTGLRPVPYFTVRISTKNKWSSDQVFTNTATCSNPLLLRSNPCWTYSRSRNHTEPTVRFKKHPCCTLQQVTVTQNPLYNQHKPHTAPRSRLNTCTDPLYTELQSSNSRTTLCFNSVYDFYRKQTN